MACFSIPNSTDVDSLLLLRRRGASSVTALSFTADSAGYASAVSRTSAVMEEDLIVNSSLAREATSVLLSRATT